MAVVDLSIFSALISRPLKRNTEKGGPDGAVQVDIYELGGYSSDRCEKVYELVIPRCKVVDVILALQRAKEEVL